MRLHSSTFHLFVWKHYPQFHIATKDISLNIDVSKMCMLGGRHKNLTESIGNKKRTVSNIIIPVTTKGCIQMCPKIWQHTISIAFNHWFFVYIGYSDNSLVFSLLILIHLYLILAFCQVLRIVLKHSFH